VLNLSEPADPTGHDGAAWRACAGCGILAALAPGTDRCDRCGSGSGSGSGSTPTPAALAADDFTDTDLSDLRLAGCAFAQAIADVAHHEIGEPGMGDLYGDGPDEVARLRHTLDLMHEAIREARRQLATVERRARRRATRRLSDAGRSA